MEQTKQADLKDYDEGRGTPYERISLWDFFNSFKDAKSYLELPRDGMYGIMGLNSLYLAKTGRKAVIFVEDAAQKTFIAKIAKSYDAPLAIDIYNGLEGLKKIPSASIDFVWAFNVLSDYKQMQEIVSEMGRISRKYVFFTYMNKVNYGYFIHRLHHKKTGEKWSHTDLKKSEVSEMSARLGKFGFSFDQKVILDAPWWPDIGAPMGDVAADLLGRKKKDPADKKSNEYYFPADDLVYFDDKKYHLLKKKMAKDFVIERKFPYFIKIFFAHHIGLLYKKGY
jgi:hypothetical protein